MNDISLAMSVVWVWYEPLYVWMWSLYVYECGLYECVWVWSLYVCECGLSIRVCMSVRV